MTFDPDAAVWWKDPRAEGVRRSRSGEDALRDTDEMPGERHTDVYNEREAAIGINPREPITYRPPRRPLNYDSNSSAFPPWYR
ncbi:MAG: hypothetical protein ACXW1Y_11620 [Acidimicrobiia bacterium]